MDPIARHGSLLEIPTDIEYRPVPKIALADLVWNARHSVCQIETLDSYGVTHENAALTAFLAGETPSAEALTTYAPWFDKVRSAVDRGVLVQRVHLMPDLPNDYLRFEVDYSYRGWSIPHGEDVRLVLRSSRPELSAIAFRDFYVIDDERILTPEYSDDRNYVALSEVVNRPAINFFVALKNALVADTVPLKASGPWY